MALCGIAQVVPALSVAMPRGQCKTIITETARAGHRCGADIGMALCVVADVFAAFTIAMFGR